MSMSEQPPATPKRTRGAYSRLICLGCRERRIKCELPDDVLAPDPGELRTVTTPCYRCKKLGVPCVVRRTRLGRPGLDNVETAPFAPVRGDTRQHTTSISEVSANVSGTRESLFTNPAKVQILPLRRLPILNKSTSTSKDASSSGDGRITITRRTRASKPKVRTGCLTCKIRRVIQSSLQVILPYLPFSPDQVRRGQACLSKMQNYRAQV